MSTNTNSQETQFFGSFEIKESDSHHDTVKEGLSTKIKSEPSSPRRDDPDPEPEGNESKVKSEPNSPTRSEDGYETERISSPKTKRRKTGQTANEVNSERIETNETPAASSSAANIEELIPPPKEEFNGPITFLNVLVKAELREHICSYLSLKSMKNLRLVSKTCNKNISSSKHILKQSRLLLCSKLFRKTRDEMKLKAFEKIGKTGWRNLEVKLDVFNKKIEFLIFRSLNPMFSKCRDLRIRISKNPKDEIDIDGITILNMLEFLVEFKSLKSLTIDFILTSAFQTLNSENAEMNARLRIIFAQLGEFRIEGKESVDLLKHEIKPENLLTSIHKLKSFQMPEIAICTNQIENQNGKRKVFGFGLYKLAFQSALTIVKMNLNFDGLGEFDDVKFEFPVLRELKLRETEFAKGKTFAMRFLRKQLDSTLDQLRILTLEVFKKPGNSSRVLIDFIKKKCQNLEELNLKAVKISKVEKWEFLLNFPNLRRLQISVPKVENGQLENNPGNEFLIAQFNYEIFKKLSLRGLNLNSFSSFINYGAQMVNLVHLSLLECRSAVDDEKLKFIVKNLKKLQVLEFSHCGDVTDFGVTGIRDNVNNPRSSKYSISSLRGLKVLKMIACQNITDRSCQYGINFPDLRILDISNNWKITNVGVKFIVEKNLTLDDLFLSSRMSKTIGDDLKRIVKEKAIKLHFELIQSTLRDRDDQTYNVESEVVTLSDSDTEE